MSADLSERNGQVAFAYNRDRGMPWHLTGQPVDGDQPLAVMLRESQMDFTLSKRPMSVLVDGRRYEVEDQHANVATWPDGTTKLLAIIGDRYTNVSFEDLVTWSLDLVGLSSGDAVIDTLGGLSDFRRAFAYVRFPDVTIDPHGIADKLNTGMVVTTSFDGAASAVAAFSSVRVVCSNTLAFALSRATDRVKVRHTRNAQERMREAAAAIETYAQVRDAYLLSATSLLSIPGGPALDAALEVVAPIAADATPGRSLTIAKGKRDAIAGLAKGGESTAPVVGWNGWAVYNAVAEWLDWSSPLRGHDNTGQVRGERALLGTHHEAKRDVASAILATAS